MPVHVEQLTSEVTTERQEAPTAGGQAEGEAWRRDEEHRRAAYRLRRESDRTRAEGFDD